MLTKEEMQELLNEITGEMTMPFYKRFEENIETLRRFIDEHFELKEHYDYLNLKVIEQNMREMNYLIDRNNPPLKFEELEVYHWYWDEPLHEYFYVTCINKEFETISTDWEESDGIYDIKYFEENRFYRYEVKEDE